MNPTRIIIIGGGFAGVRRRTNARSFSLTSRTIWCSRLFWRKWRITGG